ncbi:MAG TPA: NAD(P)H-dependent oxidoreductase subunit E [Anaerolineales bacterium]|nr:NAD(P)H-dependent oxidoreductase subunit E [Anaerolineales bacterium]
MSNNDQSQVKIESVVEQAIQKHGVHTDAMIPILLEVNQKLGYIPVQALSEVRKRLHMPSEGMFVYDSRLYSIASFYHMLSTKPLGKHVVLFCESAPCHVVGGREVWTKLRETLNLKNGETTPDGKWSLVTTSCLGACGVGPVIVVDEDMYGNVTPEQVEQILSRYA